MSERWWAAVEAEQDKYDDEEPWEGLADGEERRRVRARPKRPKRPPPSASRQEDDHMTAKTTVWHYIMTLGTYPAPDPTDMKMYTFSGTLTLDAEAGRSEVYEKLRATLTTGYPTLGLADAVVIHSDIQPNTP